MPTVHYISRETLRKHGIDPLQWELMNDKKRRVTTTNDAFATNVKAEVLDGTIRVNAAGTAAAKSEEQQLPYKSTGMDNINDAEDNTSNISSSSSSSTSKLNDVQPVQQSRYRKEVIIQRMDNLQEDECHKHSEPNKSKQKKDFFSRVDKLRAYKEKHGHLNLRHKGDRGLYNFSRTLRSARRAIITGKGRNYTLDGDRIAALDAIGFDWKLEVGVSSTVASNNDFFFARVDKLKAYKEEHGHLNVRPKEDRSLYDFCNTLRSARRFLITGKGKIHYSLDGDRIAALDAIGFDWRLRDGVSSTAASMDDKFFAQVDKLRAYKEKHSHLNVRPKDDKSLYGFSCRMRRTRRAILTGEGKIHYLLDDIRIAALDAIGFNWELGDGVSYTAASLDDKFFAQLDKLRAYKEKHGHLKVSHKDEDRSLYNFCSTLRYVRKGKRAYRLNDGRIAALDAIGFDWNPLELKMSSTLPSANSRVQPPYKTTGMDSINKDEGGNYCVATRYSSLRRKSSKPKVNSFFDRVEELKAYKEKHGHFNVRSKDDSSLSTFCSNVRTAQRHVMSGKGTRYKLTEDRIAALDAIDFDWKLRDRASSTLASKDDSFIIRVDKLRAYKEKHGHLNVRWKGNRSLYGFCNTLRSARRFLITGKGTNYPLDGDRIAALDAIGFDWKLRDGGSSTATSRDDIFFAQVDKLRVYKEKHGHLNVLKKEDQSLYDFSYNLRRSRKGNGPYRLDETRIAALDAIGFNWDPLELKMSSTSPCAMTSNSSHGVNSSKINIGDVGYQFLKEFDSGWYNGTVIEILPHADDGWDRRCIYEDGDCEDLTLNELIRLATFSPQEHVGTIKVVGDVKVAATGECPS